MVDKIEITDSIEFRYSKLGAPFITRLNSDYVGIDTSISTRAWTPNELRLIADFIEANPHCKLYDDGSGKESYDRFFEKLGVTE